MTETTTTQPPARGTRIVSKKDGQTYTVVGVEDSTGRGEHPTKDLIDVRVETFNDIWRIIISAYRQR